MTDRTPLADLPLIATDPWLLEQVKGSPDGRVLFVGAGTGRTALPLAAACDELVVVEGDARLRRTLEARLADLGPVADRVEVVGVDPARLATGRSCGLVVVPASLVNATHDPSRRLDVVRAATRHCSPDGLVVIEVLDPYWVMAAELDVAGRWDPDPQGRGVRLEVRDHGADHWEQRRRATLTYHSSDGRVVRDRFDVTALFPRELRALLFQAGLVLEQRHVPGDPPGTTWQLACRILG